MPNGRAVDGACRFGSNPEPGNPETPRRVRRRQSRFWRQSSRPKPSRAPPPSRSRPSSTMFLISWTAALTSRPVTSQMPSCRMRRTHPVSCSISRIFDPPLPMMRPVWPAHSTSTTSPRPPSRRSRSTGASSSAASSAAAPRAGAAVATSSGRKSSRATRTKRPANLVSSRSAAARFAAAASGMMAVASPERTTTLDASTPRNLAILAASAPGGMPLTRTRATDPSSAAPSPPPPSFFARFAALRSARAAASSAPSASRFDFFSFLDEESPSRRFSPIARARRTDPLARRGVSPRGSGHRAETSRRARVLVGAQRATASFSALENISSRRRQRRVRSTFGRCVSRLARLPSAAPARCTSPPRHAINTGQYQSTHRPDRFGRRLVAGAAARPFSNAALAESSRARAPRPPRLPSTPRTPPTPPALRVVSA